MLHTWTTCPQWETQTFHKPLKLVPYKSICFHNNVLKHYPNNSRHLFMISDHSLNSRLQRWLAGVTSTLQKRSVWDQKQGSQGQTSFTYWAAPLHSSYCRASFSSTATGRHCAATAGPPASLLKTCNAHTATACSGHSRNTPTFCSIAQGQEHKRHFQVLSSIAFL